MWMSSVYIFALLLAFLHSLVQLTRVFKLTSNAQAQSKTMMVINVGLFTIIFVVQVFYAII